jgi:hypothetical protein
MDWYIRSRVFHNLFHLPTPPGDGNITEKHSKLPSCIEWRNFRPVNTRNLESSRTWTRDADEWSNGQNYFLLLPLWNIGHPWNALFHFSFFIRTPWTGGPARRKATIYTGRNAVHTLGHAVTMIDRREIHSLLIPWSREHWKVSLRCLTGPECNVSCWARIQKCVSVLTKCKESRIASCNSYHNTVTC